MTDEFYVAAVRIQIIATTVTYNFFFFSGSPQAKHGHVKVKVVRR
jgi:hypothetical protein